MINIKIMKKHILILLSISLNSCTVPIGVSGNLNDKVISQDSSDKKAENKVNPDIKDKTQDSTSLNDENDKETKSSDTNINASTQQSGEASVVNQNSSSVSTGRSTTNTSVNQNNTDNRDDIPPIPDDIVYNETIVNDESIQKRLDELETHPRYDINYPIPDIKYTDNISLLVSVIFKDEFEVRYYKDKKAFISRTGADLTNINNIIDESLMEVSSINLFSDETQSEIDKIEEKYKNYQNNVNKDSLYETPNFLSMYTIYVKSDVKMLIEELRKDPNVLSCNYIGEPVTVGD